MSRTFNIGLTAVFCLTLLSLTLTAQDYSADTITVSGAGVTKGKIYHTATKIRNDTFLVDQKSGSVSQTYVITDHTEKLIYVVQPQKKTILVNHVLQSLSDLTSAISASSCAELLKSVGSLLSGAYEDCRQLGSEVVNGRSAVKWTFQRMVGKMAMPFNVWVDSTLQVPVKWEGMGSTSELRNVQLGTQSADLFALPAGYRRQDLGL